MALAALWGIHEDELRADLQRIYGIDLDHAVAGGHTPIHVGALVNCLPLDALVNIARDKDAAWTRQETILAALLNNLRTMMWGMSDKRTRGAAPQNLGPSWMTEPQRRTLPAQTMRVDDLMDQLTRPRRAKNV